MITVYNCDQKAFDSLVGVKGLESSTLAFLYNNDTRLGVNLRLSSITKPTDSKLILLPNFAFIAEDESTCYLLSHIFKAIGCKQQETLQPNVLYYKSTENKISEVNERFTPSLVQIVAEKDFKLYLTKECAKSTIVSVNKFVPTRTIKSLSDLNLFLKPKNTTHAVTNKTKHLEINQICAVWDDGQDPQLLFVESVCEDAYPVVVRHRDSSYMRYKNYRPVLFNNQKFNSLHDFKDLYFKDVRCPNEMRALSYDPTNKLIAFVTNTGFVIMVTTKELFDWYKYSTNCKDWNYIGNQVSSYEEMDGLDDPYTFIYIINK